MSCLESVLSYSPEEAHTFLTFRKKEGEVEWEYKTFGICKRLLRKIFGFYRCTHQKRVSRVLKKELKPTLSFDKNAADIKKIILIAQLTLKLDRSSTPTGNEGFRCFVEQNQSAFTTMLSTGVSFKIKNKKILFSHRILVADQKIYHLKTDILGNSLPREGCKKVQPAYCYQSKEEFARIVLKTSKPHKEYAEREFKYLKKVRGMKGCVQLISSFRRGQSKIDMILEKADGDLNDLNQKYKECLQTDQINSIARQLLEILAALEKKKIWHMDIKLANFLYFYQEGSLRIALTDFEFSTTGRWVTKQKGTPGYMAPEIKDSSRFVGTVFWHLLKKNGKRADIYSMGVVLDKLFSGHDAKTKPLKRLIRNMKNDNPKKRPTAKQALERFNTQVRSKSRV